MGIIGALIAWSVLIVGTLLEQNLDDLVLKVGSLCLCSIKDTVVAC